jgi:hypothetical protein
MASSSSDEDHEKDEGRDETIYFFRTNVEASGRPISPPYLVKCPHSSIE